MNQIVQMSASGPKAPTHRADDKRERTRRAIVQTSLRLIAEKGVEATSVLEVTTALGISNGAFYYHFRSKDQLLEFVGRSVVESLIAQIESVCHADPAQNIARGPIVVVRHFVDNPQLRTIVLRVVIDEERNHQSLHDSLREHVARGKAMGRFPIASVELAVAFARSVVAGALREFSPGCDPVVLGKQASIHTLSLLGLPIWEAHIIVEQECARIDADCADCSEPSV